MEGIRNLSHYPSQTPKNNPERYAQLERRVEELEKRLIVVGTGGGGGGGAGGGTGPGPGTTQCGLTFNPTSLEFGNIPTTGSAAVIATCQVISSIDQTVTFLASYKGVAPICLSPPTVNPSTFAFTAGQSVTVVVRVPYSGCANGATATVILSANTSTQCSVATGGSGSVTAVTGTSPCAYLDSGVSAPFWVRAGASWNVEICDIHARCHICAAGLGGDYWTPVFTCPCNLGVDCTGFEIWAGGSQWYELGWGSNGQPFYATGPGAGGDPANGSGPLCQDVESAVLCYYAPGNPSQCTCNC